MPYDPRDNLPGERNTAHDDHHPFYFNRRRKKLDSVKMVKKYVVINDEVSSRANMLSTGEVDRPFQIKTNAHEGASIESSVGGTTTTATTASNGTGKREPTPMMTTSELRKLVDRLSSISTKPEPVPLTVVIEKQTFISREHQDKSVNRLSRLPKRRQRNSRKD